ncbi:MAG: Fe-S-binding domain-containing protein, partial [Gemmatimonadota bacterium]|nr:Fe-S-binding domain-containing protein [Gemmatimonadota bacterium]
MGDTSTLSTVLNIVLFMPLVGIALLSLVPTSKPALTPGLTFAFMLLQFVLTLWLYLNFSSTTAGLQFETK